MLNTRSFASLSKVVPDELAGKRSMRKKMNAGVEAMGVADDVQRTFDAKLGTAVGLFSGASTIGLLGFDFGVPVLFGAPSKAMHLTGSLANKMGATGVATTFNNLGTKINAPRAFLNERTIGSLKSADRIAGVAETISNGFYGLASRINDFTGLFSRSATKAAAAATAHTETAQALIGKVQHPELAAGLAEYLGSATLSAAQFESGLKPVKGLVALHAASGSDAKTAAKVLSLADKAHTSHWKSVDAHNLAKGVHNTRDVVKGLSVQQGISKSLWGTASVASTAVFAHETYTDMKALRGLVADLQGKNIDDVTSGDVLFSELPYAGNVARRALISAAGPKAVLEAVNQVFNIKMIRGSHANMLMFLAPMVGSAAVSMLTSGNILDVYKEMKHSETMGLGNAPDQYAKLIGMAHKELHILHGESDSKFSQELGRIYAEKNATVAETLQDVMSGKIDKEIEQLRHGAKPEAHVQASPAVAELPSAAMNVVDNVSANAGMPAIATAQQPADAGFAAKIMAAQHAHQPSARA